MGFLETILTSLLIAVVLPIAFSVIWFCKLREEKKFDTKDVIRTRPPKILSGFFLGFALFVFIGGIASIIYCCIADSENTTATAVILISLCVAILSGIGFFGYAYVRFNFVVADSEGVLAYRLFRKKKFYRYEDINYFEDTIGLGMYGGLTGYDKDNKKIFAIEAAHVGASAVAQRLREHGVSEKFKNKLNFKL